MKSRFMFLALTILVSAGCAWTGQEVNLKPNITVKESSIGKGKAISVNVDDERPRKALGNKMPNGGGEINSVRDPKEIVEESLLFGLTRLGFKPGIQNNNSTKLKAELRSIDYKIAMGFWMGTLTVDVALKGICKVDGQIKYEKLHRGKREESVGRVQSEDENKEYIENAMSQAFNSLLSDNDLINCLAGTTGGAAL
jgi:uncharacterized lipoprotein